MKVRASSLPLLMVCAAAQVEPEVRIIQSSPQARDGSAAHELLRGLPEVGRVDWGALAEVAERHQADPAEVRMLVANGVAMWPELAPLFGGGVAEPELTLCLGDFALTGHTDLTAFRAEFARILDWKGGRLDSDYRWQMRAYCALVLANFPELAEATATVVWLRDRDIENYTLLRGDLGKWIATVRDHLEGWDGHSYTPGSHCQYCPRSHECPARLRLVEEAVAVVTRERPNLASMPADAMIELYDMAGEVERLAKRVREAIRTRVLWAGDVEGSKLALRSRRETRRHVDPRLAWRVLEDRYGFSDADFAQCLTMHAPEVEAIVRDRAPHRGKTRAVRELREALTEAGALTEVEFRKVSKRRL